MRTLSIEDLDSLALGAAILGSGGGGSPSYNRLITQYMIETHGPIQMRQVGSLTREDLVLPVAFMGAPLVALEKFASGHEFPALLDAFERHMGRRPTCIMPAEIGGANAFTPLWVGAALGIPVLDADVIGRAFPELQMSTCVLKGISASPAFLADALGNTVILNAQEGLMVERLARHVTMAMGSRAAVALYPMNGITAAETVVANSISHAIAIGRALTLARSQKLPLSQAVAEAAGGKVLASGTIIDVNHRVEGGFLKGKSCLLPDQDPEKIEILYQNEYLIATQQQRLLACTPDILTLMEQTTGIPVMSDTLAIGLQVDLVTLPAPTIWRSAQGLACVGPRYFSYPFDYKGFNT